MYGNMAEAADHRQWQAWEAADPARRERVLDADEYLASRTGCYKWRCERYRAAVDVIEREHDHATHCTVFDVGAGATEFGRFLWERGYSGRYFPVDACIDGVDLNEWVPQRTADWFVCLEVIEHVWDPVRLLRAMQNAALRGVIVSTPNPATTDVLGMDKTHVTPVSHAVLSSLAFDVEPRSFYGKPDDSLFGVWLA